MRARAWLRTRLLSCWLLAGFASAAFAQNPPAPLPDPAADLPRIAVYVTGGVPENEKNALGNRMLASLI